MMKNTLRYVMAGLFLLAAGLPAYAADSHTSTTPKPAAASVTQAAVNINTADVQAIVNAHLKGIGKKRAEAVVAYRNQHGPFKSLDDLKNIKGISEKIIAANRDKLKLN